MIKTTNLRLNLDKPDHRKAYDILKGSDMSYSNTIVAALISFSENEENRKKLFDGIRKIVREEIGTVYRNEDFEQEAISAEITNSENAADKEIPKNDDYENPDESDFDENEDFVDDVFLKCEIFVKWYDFFQGGMISKSHCFGISFKNRLKWS